VVCTVPQNSSKSVAATATPCGVHYLYLGCVSERSEHKRLVSEANTRQSRPSRVSVMLPSLNEQAVWLDAVIVFFFETRLLDDLAADDCVQLLRPGRWCDLRRCSQYESKKKASCADLCADRCQLCGGA